MEREDCWMSFSEALEQFLSARESIAHEKSRFNLELHEASLKEADHLDALTHSTHLRSH